MSFWGGLFGQGKSDDDLPSAAAAGPPPLQLKTKSSGGPPPTTTTTAGPPPSSTPAGPPPTAQAYVNQPSATIKARSETVPAVPAVAAPKFQIFQPQQQQLPEPSDEATSAVEHHHDAPHEEKGMKDSQQQQQQQQIDETPEAAAAVAVFEESSANEKECQDKILPEDFPAGVIAIQEPAASVIDAPHNILNGSASATLSPERKPRVQVSNTASAENAENNNTDWDWEEDNDSSSSEESVSTNGQLESESDDDDGEDDDDSEDGNDKDSDKYKELNYDDIEDPTSVATNVDDTTSTPFTPVTTLALVESPTKFSRFNFLEKESIPVPKLEEANAKRRHEFRTRVYEMDCRLGGLHALCAEESMDREAAVRALLPHLRRDLESQFDRYMGSTLSMDKERTRMLELQSRISKIHFAMVKHKHETLNELLDDRFGSLESKLTHSFLPSFRIETSKANKREAILFHKFEAITGTAARRFFEESATRKVELVLLQEQLDVNALDIMNENFLEKLRRLREDLKVEREARRQRDAQVLKDVNETIEALRRAVLEAAGEMNA